MSETGVPVASPAKPTSAQLNRVAGGAAVFAAVLAAIGSFAGSSNGGIGELVIAVALIGLATVGVVLWAVPWAMSLEEPGASVVGLVASVLGLLTVVIYWSGLTPVLAVAGIVLGRTGRGAWQGRIYASAAVAIGVLALVLDVVAYLMYLL